MRSFVDYRKNELRRDLNRLNVKEGFNRHFDILRFDLMDAVKLPELVFENVSHNVAYEKLRRDDYLYTCRYVEDLTRLCKDQFFDTLMLEVAGTAPAPTLDSLKAELVAELKRMIDDLKSKITSMLSANPAAAGAGDPATADPEDHIEGDADDPAAASVAASASRSPAPTHSPASGGSHAPSGRGAPVAPAAGDDDGLEVDDGSGAPASSGPVYKDFGKNAWDQPTTPFAGKRDLAKPSDDGTHPAPYGSLFPSKDKGGFWGGVKRLGKAYIQRPLGWLTRGIRQAWHGDDTRHMRKESLNPMEQLLVENAQQVLDMIDDFHAQLLAYIDQQIVKIAGIVGGSSGAAAASASVPASSLPGGSPKKTAAVGGGAGGKPGVTDPLAPAGAGGSAHVPVSGRGEADADAAAHKGAAVASGKVAPPSDEPASPQEEKVTELRDGKAAEKGAAALGITISGIGPGGGWSKVDPKNILLNGGPMAANFVGVRNRLYQILWEKLAASSDGQTMISTYTDNKRKTPHPKEAGKFQRGTINKKDRVTLVCQWLGVEPKGYTSGALIKLLAGYYRKSSGIPTLAGGGGGGDTAPPGDGGAGAGAGAGALNPSGAAPVGTDAGAAGKLTGDKVPVTGRPAGDAGAGAGATTGAASDPEAIATQIRDGDPDLFNHLLKQCGSREEVVKVIGMALNHFKGDAAKAIADLRAAKAEDEGTAATAGKGVPPPVGDAGKGVPPPVTGGTAPGANGDAKAKFKQALAKEKTDPANAGFAELLDDDMVDDSELDKLLLSLNMDELDQYLAGKSMDQLKGLDALMSKYVDLAGEKYAGDDPAAVDPGAGAATSKVEPAAVDPGAGAATSKVEPAAVDPGAGAATGKVDVAPTGDPVQDALAKAKAVSGDAGGDAVAPQAAAVGREALANDPRLGTATRELRTKLAASNPDPRAVKKQTNGILDQADAIADKEGVDAALAFLKQQADGIAAAPTSDPAAGQPVAPAGGELEKGDPVDAKALQIDKQAQHAISGFEDQMLIHHPNMDTSELETLTREIRAQYEKVKASKGPEEAFARVQDMIGTHMGHNAPEAPEQAGVDDPVKPPVKAGKVPVVKPPLPTGAMPPPPSKKAQQGAADFKELSDSPEFQALVSNLSNLGGLENILNKVKKGNLRPASAMKQIAKLAEKEAAAGAGEAEPDYSKGYYGGDDPEDGDDPRQHRKAGKRKKRKRGEDEDRSAFDRDDPGKDRFQDDFNDDDPNYMKKEGFGSILNRFRQLLAG